MKINYTVEIPDDLQNEGLDKVQGSLHTLAKGWQDSARTLYNAVNELYKATGNVPPKDLQVLGFFLEATKDLGKWKDHELGGNE